MVAPASRNEGSSVSPPASASHVAARRRQWRVELSTASHSLLWVFNVVIYSATGGACLFTTLTYAALLMYKSGYTIEYVGALGVQYIPFVILAYCIAGVLCLRSLFKQLFASCKLRRLAFYGEVPRLLPPSKSPPKKRKCLQTILTSCWTACCTRAGLCGVDSEYFDLLFLQREAIEVVLQTYQCYRASWLLSQTWLNHVYVATLVINCWGTPVLLKLAKRDTAMLRLWCLVADVLLDFVAGVAIPVVIVKTINGDPRATERKKPGVVYLFDVPFDDVYLIELLLAIKQVISMNWLDFVSKLTPIYSIISCLNKIQLLA